MLAFQKECQDRGGGHLRPHQEVWNEPDTISRGEVHHRQVALFDCQGLHASGHLVSNPRDDAALSPTAKRHSVVTPQERHATHALTTFARATHHVHPLRRRSSVGARAMTQRNLPGVSSFRVGDVDGRDTGTLTLCGASVSVKIKANFTPIDLPHVSQRTQFEGFWLQRFFQTKER